MIDLLFQFGGDMVLVRIDGNSILFGHTKFGAKLADISGLKLNKSGVIKEHPDLEGDESWREEAIKRFKEYIKSLKSESLKADYIISDLRKHGYIFKRKQIAGRRLTNG